jgi:hypothetical protein
MIALLPVYVVRVILMLILITSAPMWVACHALPHTGDIARWGWRALGATLGCKPLHSDPRAVERIREPMYTERCRRTRRQVTATVPPRGD